MNRIKLGFFSFSELPDPAAYVEWHQMDHMPEQFRISGLVWGQRFVATTRCVDASAVRAGTIGTAGHLQYYLMEDPARVFEEFSALGRELSGLGRLRTDIVSCAQASLQLLETHAAPRVQISPEAVPYRPNQGVYVIVEETVDPDGLDAWLRREHEHGLTALLEVEGVVGVWSFGPTGAYGIPSPDLRVTMVYLDEDPVRVSAPLGDVLAARWHLAPVKPVLAAPFESLFPPPVPWIRNEG